MSEIRFDTVILPPDLAEAARARAGPVGLAAYVTAAVARQLVLDLLDELIEKAKTGAGSMTEELISVRRAIFAPAHEAHDTAASVT